MRTSAYKYICGFETEAPIEVPVGFKSKGNRTWRREPITEEDILELIGNTPYTPIYYYVQDIRHMLGLNLSDEVKIPRFKYDRLRREAMLAGLGYVNEAKFKGRLAYLRSIEPTRAEKITAIYNKYKEMEPNVNPNL